MYEKQRPDPSMGAEIMRIIEITASHSHKYGLPGYSSFEIFLSAKAQVESADGRAEREIRALHKTLKDAVESEGEEYLKKYYETREAVKEKHNGGINI
jgi:hypothetical protein